MKPNEILVNDVNGTQTLYQGASPDRSPASELLGSSRYPTFSK